MKNVLTVLLVIVLLYVAYKLIARSGSNKVKGGSPPNAEDIACASGTPIGRIVGSCTRPKVYPIRSPIREKCFTSEELNVAEGEEGPSKVTDNNGWGTTWFLNYQSGDRFCYVNRWK